MPQVPSMPTSLPLTTSLASTLSSAYAEWLPKLAPWSLYVTLTYDPKRPEVHDCAPSHWASERHVQTWYHAAARLLDRPTYLAATLEHHSSGWPHWHGLLAAGQLSSREFAVLCAEWYSRRGAANFARIAPGTQPAVAAYCAKYLAKEGGSMALLGPWQRCRALLQTRF